VGDDERDQLVAELTAVHRQMLERDAVFARCDEELRLRDEHLAKVQRDLAKTQGQLAEAGAHIEDLTSQIEDIKATRAWRLAEAIWSARSRLRRVFSR
jgi:septal ring factor EnvC (AmiA/AmiB activator)